MMTTSRYEETAFYRAELEAAKRENENLKRRIRDLERRFRDRRPSQSGHSRSESASTTASIPGAQAAGGTNIAGPRDAPAQRSDRERGMTIQSVASAAGSVGIGVPEEELMVGESAASSAHPENNP